MVYIDNLLQINEYITTIYAKDSLHKPDRRLNLHV